MLSLSRGAVPLQAELSEDGGHSDDESDDDDDAAEREQLLVNALASCDCVRHHDTSMRLLSGTLMHACLPYLNFHGAACQIHPCLKLDTGFLADLCLSTLRRVLAAAGGPNRG